MSDDEFRIDITDADIKAAKRRWEAARDGDERPDRVRELFGEYAALIHAQAQQIADDFRRGHS